jgi:hypothetical protein
MVDEHNFFKSIKEHPDRFYIIHYSSQSLFDAETDSLSPRITSVVVMHFASRQTVSFALHAVAETLQIPKNEVINRYDEIERELLKRFYEFARDRREKYWIHWNMRNLTFGFEHLEHRYRVLTKSEPPSIPVEVRLNLNDILKQRYGSDYAPDPRMLNLMKLNGEVVQAFLSGAEEAEAFRQQDYIRMNASTIAKVAFFHHVIRAALSGKLKTASKGLIVRIDRLLESRLSRVIALFAALSGVLTTIVAAIPWLVKFIP